MPKEENALKFSDIVNESGMNEVMREQFDQETIDGWDIIVVSNTEEFQDKVTEYTNKYQSGLISAREWLMDVMVAVYD